MGLLSTDSHLWITPGRAQRLLERAEQERRGGARNQARADQPRVHRIQRRLGDNQVAELIRGYEAGESCAGLAKRFHVGKASVIRLLHAHDVEMRPKHVTH